jgi:hypothetical protein
MCWWCLFFTMQQRLSSPDMLHNYKNRSRGTFCFKKNIQKSNNYWIRGKIRSIYTAVEGELRWRTKPERTMVWARYPCIPLCGLRNPPCGLDCQHADCNSSVSAKLKNLVRLKGSLGPRLDDANTSQHLPLIGGLLQALRLYIVDQSL